MITAPAEHRDGLLQWPSDVPEDAWFLAYTHSRLILEKGPKPLKPGTLYEAWAFDGEASWHIWQRNDEWACTKYDAGQHDQRQVLVQRQILSDGMIRKLQNRHIGIRYLVIHELVEFDEDGQAYVSYSCPINLE